LNIINARYTYNFQLEMMASLVEMVWKSKKKESAVSTLATYFNVYINDS